MAPSFKFALAFTAIVQAAASWAAPESLLGPLSLRLSDRKVATKPQRQQSDVVGGSFRIQGGLQDGGAAELLVIPKGATGEDVLMRVVVQVEHHGPREEDMWIRRVQVGGKWLKQKWAFKTGSAFYGNAVNYLARLGNGDWTAPVNLLKASDGLLSLAIHNKEVPTEVFQSSTAMDVALIVGPVTVSVVYKTSNKDGNNFNHLDVHLSGLASVEQEMGGLLIGDAPPPAPPPLANETETNGDGPLVLVSPFEEPSAEAATTPPAQLLQSVRDDVSSDYRYSPE